MQMTRRQVLIGLGIGSTAIAFGAEGKTPVGQGLPSKMRLGSVTYNIAKDWDVPALIKNFEEAGFEGVELRTTHAHGVEVSLGKQERADVRKKFADSKVELMGLGSAFEYQMPDQSRLKKEIEATKE